MSEYRNLPNGYIVERSSIIGYTGNVFTVWVPGDRADCATITTINGVWYGDYATIRFPGCAHPYGSPERIAAVDAWYDGLVRDTHVLIRQAFPELPVNAYSHGYIKTA